LKEKYLAEHWYIAFQELKDIILALKTDELVKDHMNIK
jgi:hypothetical protein